MNHERIIAELAAKIDGFLDQDAERRGSFQDIFGDTDLVARSVVENLRVADDVLSAVQMSLSRPIQQKMSQMAEDQDYPRILHGVLDGVLAFVGRSITAGAARLTAAELKASVFWQEFTAFNTRYLPITAQTMADTHAELLTEEINMAAVRKKVGQHLISDRDLASQAVMNIASLNQRMIGNLAQDVIKNILTAVQNMGLKAAGDSAGELGEEAMGRLMMATGDAEDLHFNERSSDECRQCGGRGCQRCRGGMH